MHIQNSPLEVAVLRIPQMPLQHPKISERTFVHCLNALFVNTKILTGNVISLHLCMASRTNGQDYIPALLSSFQLELVGHTVEIERELAARHTTPAAFYEWSAYSDLRRIPDIKNVKAGLVQLRDATDGLSMLYESILSIALEQQDQWQTFYLLANQLVSFHAYFIMLDYASESI